jgi:two-component system, NtrC family, nitrogen regulation response regulator GlnG
VKQILIIDDEEVVCWSLQRALARQGHAVLTAATAEQGLKLFAQHRPDVVILDVRLPGMDGLTALPRMHEQAPDVPVIVITAFGNLPTAVKAMEGGAFDYLTKPFDLDQALAAVQRALNRRPTAPAEEAPGPAVEPEEIVGRGPAMQAVFKRIALVAPRDSCVLISGESGTGKELVARAIHRYSSRRDRPLLPVHIAALNPNLVESELFGHVRGAFTGAAQARTGLLSLADGGTVFLDELAEIALPVQVKLLRVLEHDEVLPVGANQPLPLNVRILTATNQDLARCVAEGKFRHDLFFRLNVFQIALPPLRERPEDVEPLAEHFLRRFDPRVLPLPAATVRFLQGQPWYGNVRELRNALEHAAILARGSPLLPEHFPRLTSPTGAGSPAEQLANAVRLWLAERTRNSAKTPPGDLYTELLHCVEPPLLDEVMRRLQGNRWAAAQWLGLNRATVRKKLAHYDLYQTPSAEAEDAEEGTQLNSD